MKYTVILTLGLVATVLATPHISELRARRQAASTTPSAGCDGQTGSGLAGVLLQVGYLVGNLVDNLANIRTSGNGSVPKLLSDLLTEVQTLLTDLLLPSSNDAQSTQKQGTLEVLIGDIVDLVNSLLGDGAASSWPCTRPTGAIGGTLATVIGSVGSLTGSLTNGNGLVSSLLKVVLSLVTNLLNTLLFRTTGD